MPCFQVSKRTQKKAATIQKEQAAPIDAPFLQRAAFRRHVMDTTKTLNKKQKLWWNQAALDVLQTYMESKLVECLQLAWRLRTQCAERLKLRKTDIELVRHIKGYHQA